MSMATRSSAHKRVDIYDSEIGTRVREELESLQANPAYITEDGYTSDKEQYPDGKIGFVPLHLLHLHKHPLENPLHYMSNLRLKLRIR